VSTGKMMRRALLSHSSADKGQVRDAVRTRGIDGRLFRLAGSMKRDPAIERWIQVHRDELGQIAKHWFGVMRECGDDVRESLHDGCPTACVGDAAFAYVNAFKAHVNVGFFRGAELRDPKGLLEGTGKFMRHVKLRPGREFDAEVLSKLVHTAYTDMKKLSMRI
jgi:hypothetical protein